jgi:hypothetical protein
MVPLAEALFGELPITLKDLIQTGQFNLVKIRLD